MIVITTKNRQKVRRCRHSRPVLRHTRSHLRTRITRSVRIFWKIFQQFKELRFRNFLIHIHKCREVLKKTNWWKWNHQLPLYNWPGQTRGWSVSTHTSHGGKPLIKKQMDGGLAIERSPFLSSLWWKFDLYQFVWETLADAALRFPEINKFLWEKKFLRTRQSNQRQKQKFVPNVTIN